MTFKNSLKLLASNFSIVWKHLVYMLIVGAITVGLVFLFAAPSVEILTESGWVDTAKSLFATIYTEPTTVFLVIKELALSFFNVLAANFSSLWYSILGLIITGYFVPRFLLNISDYNVCSIAEKQITSLLHVGYTQNMVSTLRTSSKYAVVKMMIQLPFDVIKVLLVISFFRLSTSFISSLLFLSLLSMFLILVQSIEITMLAGFAPYMIEFGGNPFKCYLKSSVPIFKKFEKVFSNAIIVVLACLFVNLLLGVFTAFSALLITIPATAVFVCIFSNVAYLTMTEKRYYLSPSIIVNPKINDVKPEEPKEIKG